MSIFIPRANRKIFEKELKGNESSKTKNNSPPSKSQIKKDAIIEKHNDILYAIPPNYTDCENHKVK